MVGNLFRVIEWKEHDVGSNRVPSSCSDYMCGAFSSHGEWFQLVWPESWLQLHITVKELLPVVISIAIWGKLWSGKTVHCRCDNAAVVAIVR